MISRLLRAALLPLALWATTAPVMARAVRHYVQGDVAAPTPGPVSGGLLLMGGGDHNLAAMRWFNAKAGHGHLVVLSGSLAGETGAEFFSETGGLASAETFVITGRKGAFDPTVIAALHRADAIFLAGGDQARYVRRWRGTPVATAIDAHVAAGKPLGGTSAGLAVLGEVLYGAIDGGSQTSARALADPFGQANTIEHDFLHIALMKGVITDSHFTERNRLGRLFAFMAKAQAGWPADRAPLIGLGIDESAAVTVEPDGTGTVHATDPQGGAWVVSGEALRKGPDKDTGKDKNTGARRALEVRGVVVIGAGPQSRIALPHGTVENPRFVRYYDAIDGTVTMTREVR